jgi:peptide/nickel transport system substrate-binding protein
MRCTALIAVAMLHLGIAQPAWSAEARGSLSVALGAEPTILDPVGYVGGVDTYMIAQLFEQLLRPDATGKEQNWLAEDWKIGGDADKPVVEITLRAGVTFTNGDPMTADDVAFSYERLRDPKAGRWSYQQADVESVEVVDPLHLRIHFRRPNANYLTNHLTLWIMPRHYFEKVGLAGFAKAPVGTGPWRFVSWQVKEEMHLQAYDGYWNKQHRPGVKDLVVKFIPEDLTRAAAYRTGVVDLIDAVPPAMIHDFQALPDTTVQSAVDGNNLFITFPPQEGGTPFRDLRVRQAVAHAIDVDAIIRTVLFGQGERYEEIGAGEIGYDSALRPYGYDPKRARELLREAGYPNGFDTPCYNLTVPREPYFKEVGDAMFASLTAVGIRCKTVTMDYMPWVMMGRRDATGHMKLDGLISQMWGHGIPGDPGTSWDGLLHSYVPGTAFGLFGTISDPETDTLLDQQRETLDATKRAALLQRIAHIKHDKLLGTLSTYRPMVTFAWRTSKVSFTPWPWPGYWRSFQELGIRQ